jgi:formate C-acetyltransferase
MYERSFTDRTHEWFEKEELPDLGNAKELENVSLVIRRALALKGMLQIMTKENGPNIYSREIKDGELIVGNIPMGSLGFGKTFPNYLTDEEKHVAFFSSRDITSVLGHNAPDYSRLLKLGLKGIMEISQKGIDEVTALEEKKTLSVFEKKKRIFYEAVIISCEAVIEYANCFADLVEKKATGKTDEEKAELLEVARICRKVPYEPAESFHEALQSIYFLHLTFHASNSHVSFGRLDQVLEPCLQNSLKKGEITLDRAQELVECFFIKCAERLTSTMEYAVKQDFADFATGMGNSPFLVDQEATLNQFMQNIVIGGQTIHGEDATNDSTYLILDACASLGIITPVVNLRLHKNSPIELVEKAAKASLTGNNGLPIIYNDEAIVPALQLNKKLSKEDTYDYIIDGCWEVLLNGKCDFTYNMVNMLTVMECTLNRGALLSSPSMYLRGQKQSYLSKKPEEIKTYEQFKSVFEEQLQYFVNKVCMQLYDNYCLEGSVTPVPLFSSLLGTCLERGVDKTSGGCEFNLGGVVYIAMPNAANSLASIKKWVFEKKKYSLTEVIEALKNNYGFGGKESPKKEVWNRIYQDFKNDTPKFGNSDAYVDNEMQYLLDISYKKLMKAEELCDEIYLSKVGEMSESELNKIRRIRRLRRMAGFQNSSEDLNFGGHFSISFSAGCGTFAQYAMFGAGCAASADGRLQGEPVAPNFSPNSGTATHGEGAILSSLKNLRLDKYALGAIVDVCIPKDNVNKDYIENIYHKFIESNGSILSLTVPGAENIQKAYETCQEVRDEKKEQAELQEFADLNVRVGGWNGPFITLTEVQQDDYMERRIFKNKN